MNKMIISAIDIGSNSVRLATFAGGKTLYKRLATTRLGEGLAHSGALLPEAIERTAIAVAAFFDEAKKSGAEKVYAFATAAARSSKNGADFVVRVKELCGLQVDVISGEQEAQCGILGALSGGDGGIIDVGGASTEVTFQRGGKVVYAKSVNIGTVRLNDLAGRDRTKLLKVIEDKLLEYGYFSAGDLPVYAIGGTATRLAAVKHNLLEYTPEITDGTIIDLPEMELLTDRLLTAPIEEIRRNTICKKSADVVGGGSLLLLSIMKKFGANSIIVSEKDNLEGYIILREGKL